MAKEKANSQMMKLSESSVREQMEQHQTQLGEVEKVIAQAQQVLNQNVEQRGMLRGAIQGLQILLGEDPQVGDQPPAPPEEAPAATPQA